MTIEAQGQQVINGDCAECRIGAVLQRTLPEEGD